MKKNLQKFLCPEKMRGLAYAMAFTLLLSSLLAPLTPVIESSTASNYSDALQRAAAQPLEPLDPSDDSSGDGMSDDSSGDGMSDDSSGDGMSDDSSGDGMGDDSSGDGMSDSLDDGDDLSGEEIGDSQEPQFNDPALINVTVRWCPVNANVSGATDGFLLENECTNSGPEVLVILDSTTRVDQQQQSVATSFPGQAIFSQLAEDDWKLDFRTAPYVTEALFCEGSLYVDGNLSTNTKPYGALFRSQVISQGFDLSTQNNEVIDCYWFGQMVDTAFLGLTKFNCPEGFDFATATYDSAKQACTVPVEGPVGFEVAVIGTNYMSQRDTNPASMNTVLTADVLPGTARVTEKVPQGWTLGGVFCSLTDWNNPANNTQQPVMQTIQNDNSWEYKSSAFSMTSCDVFNVPIQEAEIVPATLTVNMYWCPPGTIFPNTDLAADPSEAMADADALKAACTETGPAGTATLTSTTDPSIVLTGATSPDNKQHSFLDLPLDKWQLRIELPPLANDAMYCDGYHSMGNTKPYARFALVSSEAPVYDIETLNDEDINCDHFGEQMMMQQAGTGDFELLKYVCSETPDPSAMLSWYRDNCTTTQDGVQFNLMVPDPALPNGIQANTADNGQPGSITFSGVEIGTHDLNETPIDGYAAVAAFCAYADPGTVPLDEDFMQVMLTGNSTTVTINDGQLTYCYWYNVQLDEQMLTIWKYECPDSIVDNLQDLMVYQTQCVTEQAGVEFTIEDDNGTQTVTSAVGGVSFSNPTGIVNITEHIPTGYGVPAAFCQVSEAEGIVSAQLGGPFVSVMPNAEENVICWFYNIPLNDHSLTLYKWLCPEGTMYGQPESYYSAECDMEHPNVPFQITDDNGTRDFLSDVNGHQEDGLVGQLTLRELDLTGYGEPVVFCRLLNDNDLELYNSTGGIVILPAAMGDDYQCYWYNIPEPDSTVTIYKWRCPDGMPAEHTTSWFTNNCTTPMEVDFTLADNKGPRMLTATGGVAQWTDVATGAVQITEHIPPGYTQQPYLVCYVIAPNGIATDSFTPVTVNGTWNTTIDEPGSEIVCNWYNWYLGNGEITVYKYTCPEGYDRTGWHADPMVDCTVATNGITFVLDQPDPEIDLQSDTGDSINGAVYFGGLAPGNYTLTEMVNMGDFKDIFVWQCIGLNSSAVHPVPLSVGTELNFIISGGDSIVCYWFNVPYPDYGNMNVHKFNCSTEKYVSDVYCYTNQTGQYFDLQMWNGSTWTTVQSGTTDVSGKVAFTNLASGDYRLIEPNKQACLMKSSNITPGKNIGVNVGETTTVHVYNCKELPPDPKKPGKYPNTGVAPSASESAPVSTPGIALTGLAGLLGIAMNRRRVVAGAGLVTAGAAATALPILNAQELVPMDSTPAPGTPAPEDFYCATPTAATPGASTPVVDPCNRGPIPIHMRIPEIGVDAPIEYLEIIDGAMQQPTGDTHIAWYKETSRLGEIGNGIYAAHVNWYGNPEGIFFRLESLQEGDVIEVDGDDLQTHLFEVQWAQNFPSDEEPPEEALGLTDEIAITLITCGGEWSAALSEYDHRTLVRAVLRE